MAIAFHQLKVYRKQAGYTQEELAEKLGVTRQAVAKWENGDSMPDIESCIKLADLYQTTVDLLVRDIMTPRDDGSGRHVFGLATINSKGQITLPVVCRKVFHLEPGDMVLLLGDEAKGIAMVKMSEPSFPGRDEP